MQLERDIIDHNKGETSENEMKETGVEGMKKLRKCSHSSRPNSGHERGTGQKCKLDILNTPEE